MNILRIDYFLRLFWGFFVVLESILILLFNKKGVIGLVLVLVNLSMIFFPAFTPDPEIPPTNNPNFRQYPKKPRVTYFSQDCNTTFVLSWDDARVYDVKLAPIDEKYGISHTIFTPSYRSYPNKSYWRYAFLLDELFQGYDIQSHCGKHVHLSQYSSEKQEYFVKWGRTGLEELFDFTPIVFAYPYGDTAGSNFVKQYFDLGRTINSGGNSWPPSSWPLEGTTISLHGIADKNLHQLESNLMKIYHSEGYEVFKGYGHTNAQGRDYGVTDFDKYEDVMSKISGWPDVWYTSWGELVAYEIEKDYVDMSLIRYYDDRIEFDFSTPRLNTDIYKVPLTIGILIPKSWDNPFPQIGNKFSSRYSIRDYNDSKELLLDVPPKEFRQKITIWRDLPITDQSPPSISDFTIKTRYIEQNWDQVTPQLLHYTFLRFTVEDANANVLSVNASVYLKNGEIFDFPTIKNPIFWDNSSYGRVLWNSTLLNRDIPQITEDDIMLIKIHVQDGFGNLLQKTVYSNGKIYSHRILSSQKNLLKLKSKPKSLSNRLS